MQLDFNQRRVLGVLIEKGYTTPDQYPLTLNYLVNACNQKSCRNPQSDLDEGDVLDALDVLRQRGLASLVQTTGGRTDRFRHRFGDVFEVTKQEAAILCELFLRGPQTDGELKANSKRMATQDDLVGSLDSLMQREEPLIRRLGPQERKRGVKYAHTLYPEGEEPKAEEETFSRPSSSSPSSPAPAPPSQVTALEERIQELESTVQSLSDRLEQIERSTGMM